LLALSDYRLQSRASGPSALRASNELATRDCTLEAMRTQGFPQEQKITKGAKKAFFAFFAPFRLLPPLWRRSLF
jgi:hypothetical protein